MAKAQMETAAQKYRRIRAEKDAKAATYSWTCPDTDCGMTWQLRRVDLNFLVTSGILPLALVEKMVSATQKAGVSEQDVVKALSWKDQVQSIEFSSKVVRHVAMEPRIVDDAKQPNDITPDEVMTCCYTGILRSAMQGGEEAERLGNFRSQ